MKYVLVLVALMMIRHESQQEFEIMNARVVFAETELQKSDAKLSELDIKLTQQRAKLAEYDARCKKLESNLDELFKKPQYK